MTSFVSQHPSQNILVASKRGEHKVQIKKLKSKFHIRLHKWFLCAICKKRQLILPFTDKRVQDIYNPASMGAFCISNSLIWASAASVPSSVIYKNRLIRFTCNFICQRKYICIIYSNIQRYLNKYCTLQ